MGRSFHLLQYLRRSQEAQDCVNGKMFNSTLQQTVIREKTELYSTNYVGLAGFTMLFYDHLLTFPDEVQYIWFKSKRTISWLFLFNRYITPLGFIVNLNAYLSPAWSAMTCQHFVVYEGCMGFLGVAVASLMMLVRVRAIYDGEPYVMFILWSLYSFMFGVNVWLLTTAGPVKHIGISGCSMLFGQRVHISGAWISATAWTPLCFDTAVIVFVILRTWRTLRVKATRHSKIIRVLIRDGIMYYSVIFVINFVLAVMIVRAPDGIKNICAQLQLLLTVTMMSRITLSLRKNFHSQENSQIDVEVSDHRVQVQLRNLPRPPPKSIMKISKPRFLSASQKRYSNLEMF